MRRKVALLIVLSLLFTALTGFIIPKFAAPANAAPVYENMGYVQGIVTAYYLNMRQGPSTDYYITKVLEKDDTVRLIGKMGNWYVAIHDKSGVVGCVHSKYIKIAASVPVAETMEPLDDETGSPVAVELTEEEQILLNLVNNSRAEAGLPPLIPDPALMEVSRKKAIDMVENNYFSHESKQYGLPWDMMRASNIEFSTAGENIAGNESPEGAYEAWINSEAHRQNIFNENFTYTGVAVVDSPTYGKIIVQQFIGK